MAIKKKPAPSTTRSRLKKAVKKPLNGSLTKVQLERKSDGRRSGTPGKKSTGPRRGSSGTPRCGTTGPRRGSSGTPRCGTTGPRRGR